MQIIGHFVAANGVHIGVKPFAHFKAIFAKGISLPLGKRMNDLKIGTAVNIEFDRALHAVEVIVEPALVGHEKRRRNADQIELSGKLFFKKVFDLFDGILGLAQGQMRMIVFWKNEVWHKDLLGCEMESVL